MLANKLAANSHPVIYIPSSTPVLDLSEGFDSLNFAYEYSIGRYNEKRHNMYTTPLFKSERNIHMGIDFFAPVGTPVYAFANGIIHSVTYHSASGDYGFTVITQHQLSEKIIYALYGHLNAKSIFRKQPGQIISKGAVLGWLGDYRENGGWPSHLHFQLSLVEPVNSDLPGVVSDAQHENALQTYPDPRLVLGPVYKERKLVNKE